MENELLRTILDEVRRLNDGVAQLSGEVGRLDGRMAGLEGAVVALTDRTTRLEASNQYIRNSLLNIELKELPKIRAVFDGLAGNEEKITAQDGRIRALEDTAARHVMEIMALKQAK